MPSRKQIWAGGWWNMDRMDVWDDFIDGAGS